MLSIGIVGLPNVGKSTIFNALNEVAEAESSNYPFCTIEPNVGIVEVPDDRLDKLVEIENSEKKVPATIQFVDIAGLVKGASKGEGLGNKFLSHIKGVDAITMVVRCFEDEGIAHVSGGVNPKEDIKTIELELILADLEQVEKAIERTEKNTKTGDKKEVKRLQKLIEIKDKLEQEIPIRDIGLDEEDSELIKDIQLITTKSMFYIGNISEEQLGRSTEELDLPENSILISAKIESDMKQLSDKERKEYLNDITDGVDLRPLQQVIKRGYEVLGLVSFLTAGSQEARAWTVKRDTKAPKAAGVIHGDFEKKFVAVDVIGFEKFVEFGGWAGAKEKGLVRTEGKDYVVKDGDVLVFKHG